MTSRMDVLNILFARADPIDIVLGRADVYGKCTQIACET